MNGNDKIKIGDISPKRKKMKKRKLDSFWNFIKNLDSYKNKNLKEIKEIKMKLSLETYKLSSDIYNKDYPFYAIIAAAMRKADDMNLTKLKIMFPGLSGEISLRYNSPGGVVTDKEKEVLNEKNSP